MDLTPDELTGATTSVDPDKLDRTQVAATWIRGHMVYERT
jgi:predicted amidohydrolase YtcJ